MCTLEAGAEQYGHWVTSLLPVVISSSFSKENFALQNPRADSKALTHTSCCQAALRLCVSAWALLFHTSPQPVHPTQKF